MGVPHWGESKWAKMACSGSFKPYFVNNDYVTVEIIHSTVHVCHEVPTWLQAYLCCTYMWVPPRKWQHYWCIMAVSIGWLMRGENIAWLLLQLLCQPGERLCCVRLCYGCCVSQERINVSTVLMVPHIFFQPQCVPCVDSMNSVHSEIQWDNWYHEQDEEQYTHFINLPIEENLDYFQLLVIIDNIKASGGH